MLTRKIACQPNACVSTPPITGPLAAPTPRTDPISPKVWPWRSGGVIDRNSDWMLGPSAAANAAWATRATTRRANVVDAAASAEHTITPTRAIFIMRRLPIESDRRPAIGCPMSIANR